MRSSRGRTYEVRTENQRGVFYNKDKSSEMADRWEAEIAGNLGDRSAVTR